MKKLFFALTLLGFMATANATTLTPNSSAAVVITNSQDIDDEATS